MAADTGRRRAAFIGLGTMGRPMASRLLAAGWDLAVFDIAPAAVRPLLDAGAHGADSPLDAARQADFVVTALPNSRHVREATTGPVGALLGAPRGSVLVDLSTIDPATSRDVAREAERRGVAMLDAPVSGSSAGAADGSLTIMVGGDADVLDRARPLLDVLGTKIVHCGASGMGATVKLANQVMAGISMVATAEGFRLTRALGVDPRLLYDVSTSGSGDSWSLRTRPPVPGVLADSPADHDFRPGFTGDLMRKDLDLALSAADGVGLTLPLAAAARELYARLGPADLGRKDFSAVIEVLPRRSDGT
ncbi:3-hydroxyisobutyrate dehydrogenase [Umezawaea endophytica]|uniref:3-hydroxyisobutyrate dehydrogenase n=1 Tax=Umezawaea endophytica TaxID=1654476 RepID=A0A9X2VPU4_9PSEU|nr:3-hydroxyisobutyrate dehydrogenase [Umezawaea endophytica]MCS7480476.1 3-hydroxyisobutyrate dehydrogenase [Umezawaea endophytica]